MSDDEGCVIVILILVFLAIVGGLSSEYQPSQSPVEQDTETWQQYILPPSENLADQLANTQNLIVALGNDVSHLQTQNVDIQTALTTMDAQLRQAQEQAAEESKRQRIEQWGTTVVGAIVGWLLGWFVPTKDSLAEIRRATTKLFAGRTRSASGNSASPGSSQHRSKTDSPGCSTAMIVIWIVLFLAGLALIAWSIFY